MIIIFPLRDRNSETQNIIKSIFRGSNPYVYYSPSEYVINLYI